MPRYFTLGEARALLPVMSRFIRDAVQAKGRYQEADSYMQQLSHRILMQGGMTIDTATAEAWKNQRDASGAILKSVMDKIEDLGVQIKDLDVGLIDFPTLYHGEEVYLCWRMDEDDIGFWHGVNDGFAGRREIDAEFMENHRGEGSV